MTTQAPRASLRIDPDCGGVAAAHYGDGEVGTPRPACHRQRSEAVAYTLMLHT